VPRHNADLAPKTKWKWVEDNTGDSASYLFYLYAERVLRHFYFPSMFLRHNEQGSTWMYKQEVQQHSSINLEHG